MDAPNRGGSRGHNTSTFPNRKRKAPSGGSTGDDGRPADGAKKQRTRGGGGGAGRSDAGASTAGAGSASKRSPAELAHLAFLATGSPFVAERWPNELVMVAGLLSRGHRENIRDEAKRASLTRLNINDAVRSVAALEGAHRVAQVLLHRHAEGLHHPGIDLCRAVRPNADLFPRLDAGVASNTVSRPFHQIP